MDFSNLKVLVIGDICLDIIEEGISTRLSPEAPVPVILNPTKNYSLGMAGNVAMNLKSLGADVKLSTSYVTDKYGDKISKMCSEHNLFISETRTLAKPEATSIVKKRIMANGQQIARIDREYKAPASTLINHYEKSFDKFMEYDFDAVIISDYDKGMITEETWPVIKNLIKEYECPIFVDTKKKNIDMFKGCIITPNTKELYEILNHYDFTHPSELAEYLDSYFIETKSEDGACIHGKYFRSYSPAYTQNIIDVCGAGDTFMSAYVLYISKYNNMDAALCFANYACSKVVQKKGTSTILLHEILDFESKRYGSER